MNRAMIDQLFRAAEKESSDAKEMARLQVINVKSLRNERDQTLLHVAAGYGRTNLVSYLLSRGIDPNTTDAEGQSPLHNACCHGHFRVSSKLIEAGADVNLRDCQGWSPLHFAVARKDNSKGLTSVYWKVVELLLEHGADPHLESNSGRSCLSRLKDDEARRAIGLTYLVNKLKKIELSCCLGNGSSDNIGLNERSALVTKYLSLNDFFELVKTGDENLDVLKLVTVPELLESRLGECDNITPLHRAAGYNHIEAARWFIQQGAKVDATDDSSRIPLHNAAQYGHIEMIELLVENGSDINKKDLIGYTPLHVAASNRTFTACQVLVGLGADINLKCKAGKLPFDLAETEDVREVLKPETLRRLKLIPSSSEQAVYIALSDEQPFYDSNYEDSIANELMLDSGSDKPLFRKEHPIKKVLLKESDLHYQLVRKRMLDTIVRHDNDTGGIYTTFDILSIERVLHTKVWSKYRLMCQRLDMDFGPGKRNERLLFHGSKTVDKIILDGFDVRYAQSKGMFGAGIYFAKHSSKSNQYTFGIGQGCKEHLDRSCYICERKIILAQVALGKSLVSEQAMPDCVHGPPTFTSVTGSPELTENLQHPEYVIYNGDQAYPLFVVRYKIRL